MKLKELNETQTLPPGRCKVCSAHALMDDETRLALRAVLRNPTKAYTMIAEALADEGFPGITADVVGKHATGKCRAGIRYRKGRHEA